MRDTPGGYAIIGGTGFNDLVAKSDSSDRHGGPQGLATPGEAREVATPYGAAHVAEVEIGGGPVLFLARHGAGHAVLAHQINYRANIWALRSLGVRAVLAACSAGGINRQMQPGEFALLTQFLDFTRQRAGTFFDRPGSAAMHVDVTDPYCPSLRAALTRAGDALGEALHPSTTYVCTEGPRFETPAEINAFGVMGGDVVGMTGLPEATLAREANLCYASVAIITNWAAGVTGQALSHGEVVAAMDERRDAVWRLLGEAIVRHRAAPEPCACGQAVDEAVWRSLADADAP